MADKDYGATLSRYLDPNETGFDTVVYQKGKPILDSEFVLDQEIQNDHRAEAIRRTIPSGWLSGDFFSDGNLDFDFRSEANTFYLTNRPVANVNGWIMPVEYSDTSTAGENKIVLEAPPDSSGSYAADFVFVEVWRSLIAPDPSTDHKPSADKIYRHGNTLSQTGEWLDDDLIDPDPQINSESTKRVQIQYRIRTQRLSTVDTRVGYDDANVFARATSGANTAFQFSEDANDPGMWVAGDGDPANALGTVDGYVYSIPVCLVFRRNSAGWDFSSNGNGAELLSSGSSNRPDNLYADEIVWDDVLDLRRGVSLAGFDWEHVLERNVSLLMDQELRSSVTDTAHTNWYVGGARHIGTNYLKADDIVPSNATPSDPDSGNSFRSVDGICRVYSDRPHTERHLVRYDAATHAAGANWAQGDTVSLDFTSTSPLGAALADEQPTGTVVRDVISVTLDDAAGSGGQLDVPIDTVTGLGTQSSSVELGAVPATSDRDIWVMYDVEYPAGSGLNADVTETTTNFDLLVHNPSAFNADIGTTFTDDATGRAAIRDYLFVNFEDGPHREVQITYTTDAVVTLQVYSEDNQTIVLPEFLYEGAAGTSNGVVSVVEDPSGAAIAHTVDASGTGGRTVALSSTLTSDGELVEVEYYPKRPLPVNGATITLYYKTVAHQAVEFEFLQNASATNDLTIRPVHVGQHLYAGTASSGSALTPFPYENPMNQIPVHINADYDGEHDLSAPGEISIDDFDANTGFLKLPVMVPLAPVDSFTLKSPANVTIENEEFIDHYTTVDLTKYRPSAFAQSMSSIVEHKVFLPMLARLEQDTAFGRQGEVVLVVFAEYQPASEDNSIGFSDSGNTTCAAVYRLKGGLLSYT